MKNRNGRLMSVADFQAELAKAPEKLFAVAGDELLLARLPRGNWLGGTIPYLMSDEDGGLTTRDFDAAPSSPPRAGLPHFPP